MKRQLTDAQRAAADQRKARFRELVKNIAAMSDAERSQLAAKMIGTVSADGGVYSPRNQCLIALQCPDATVLGGFRQWLKHGRCVRKGEHGLMIWFPITRKRDGSDDAPDTADAETRFSIGTIFDVSQTELVTVDAPEPVAV